MENVTAPKKHTKMGKLTGSPNTLYKRYVAWFKTEYGTEKPPLAFKEWIKWAKHKGLVPDREAAEAMSADGQTYSWDDGSTQDDYFKKQRMERRIGMILAFVSTTATVAALFYAIKKS